MYNVTAIGELLIDFTPSGNNELGVPLFACNPGGAPANVLAMNAKLGGKCAFLGKVGDDIFGRMLTKTLSDCGIETSGVVVDPCIGTTLAFVHLTPAGDRSFSFYRNPGADQMLTADELDRKSIANGELFHFGAVSLTDEPCRSAVVEAVSCARSLGKVISFDPNYRPLLWRSEQEARAVIAQMIPCADLLKVSDEEARMLSGQTEIAAAAKSLLALGPGIVVISMGAMGAYYYCEDGAGQVATYDVPTVDTTGAGDAFWGAMLYCLRGKKRDEIAKISACELSQHVAFCNAAGSLSTTQRGAIPSLPELAAIEACMREVPLLQ